MKKLFLTILIICLSFSLFAQNRIHDNAGLLSGDQIAQLETMAREISEKYNFELVVLTETNISTTDFFAYAKEFLTNTVGQGRDGAILMQVTADRDYVLSATGRGVRVMTAAALRRLENDIVRHLRNDNYASAYREFFNTWDELLVMDQRNLSYNFFHEWNVILVVIAWIVALIVGLTVVLGWRAKMNTALAKTEANTFIVSGSLNFAKKQDKMLYSRVTKVPLSSSSSGSSTLSSLSKVGRTMSGGRGSSRGKY